MKIVHLIDSGGVYGAERVLLGLVRGQAQTGHEVSIASIHSPGEERRQLDSAARSLGFRVEPLELRWGPSFLAIRRKIAEWNRAGVNIVHSHGYRPNILLAANSGVRQRPVMLTTIHGWTASSKFSKLAAYEVLDRLAIRHLDAVVFVSSATLSRCGSARNFSGFVRTIHNGLDQVQRPESPCPPDKLHSVVLEFVRRRRTIVSIGRLSKEKGFDVLVRSLRKLVDDDIDAQLLILGDGEEREHLERLADDLGVRDRLSMPGYLQDAASLIGECSLFVLSSRTEGLPMVLLEAASLGSAIVATAVGGVQEVVENGVSAIIVRPDQADEMTDAMRSILSDGELARRLGIAAQVRVRRLFSSGGMLAQYESVYKEALKRQRGPG